jgi:hypothetical protein
MSRRLVALVLVLNVASFAVLAAGSSPQVERRHSSGLLVLGPGVVHAQPVVEDLAKAWSDAMWLARDNPDVLGYPWADEASGQLVVSVVMPAGEALVLQWAASGAQTKGPKPIKLLPPRVAFRLRTVDRSYAQLERIKHDATFLVQAGLPDANAIYKTAPDFQHNRIIVTVDRTSDPLFAALASRYGTQAVAVRVEPNPPRFGPATRDSDSSPFWGGAKLNAPVGTPCTSGFSWDFPDAMVSAGHCAPNGGTFSTPVQPMGNVTPNSEESWSAGVGTVPLDGESVNRGDISLIRMNPDRDSGAAIYTGPSGSGTSKIVREKWWRSPLVGDLFCTGGHVSGEQCDWSVTEVGVDRLYFSTNEWARNVNEGHKPAGCIQSGDSGGPVYTVRPDDGIAAKGIISGANGGVPDCKVVFTDIWEAYGGFPGDLKVQ